MFELMILRDELFDLSALKLEQSRLLLVKEMLLGY